MSKLSFLLLLLLIFTPKVFSQTESIPYNNPVYRFLEKERLKQNIYFSTDNTLPQNRSWVESLLRKCDSIPDSKNSSELDFYLNNFNLKSNSPAPYYITGGESLLDLLQKKEENYLFSFSENEFSLKFNLKGSLKSIVTDRYSSGSNNSTLFTFGGGLLIGYSDWFTGYMEVTNGIVKGNREVALNDKKVSQSYTFNKTLLDNFDNTLGYIRIKKSIFDLVIGRDELRSGVSKINPSLISGASQPFDYVKLNMIYKWFNLSFLHGWLVQPKEQILHDSVAGDIKRKEPKYIASTRFGFDISKNLNLGITQSIIYANRPVELAYFNPLSFWESSQRSLNDLDNSFLTFDLNTYPCKGVSLYGSITFDDINFAIWNSDQWNSQNTRFSFQVGANYLPLFLSDNLILRLEYYYVRPYTYSHPELGESLTYCNNSVPLGVNLNPNSDLVSVGVEYNILPNMIVSGRYFHTRHGDNLYDSNGNLIANKGGSFFISTDYKADKLVRFLDGDVKESNSYNLELKYYYSYNLNLGFNFTFVDRDYLNAGRSKSLSFIELNYNIF